jgi:chromosome segregation ATPase
MTLMASAYPGVTPRLEYVSPAVLKMAPEDGVTLKEYIDALNEAFQAQLDQIRRERELLVNQFDARNREQNAALREEFNRRLSAMDRAGGIAKEEMDAKLGRMNEFRGALADAQARMIDKDTYTVAHERLGERLDQGITRLGERLDNLSGRVRDLEGGTASTSAVETYKHWLVATGIAIAGLAALVIFNFVRIQTGG